VGGGRKKWGKKKLRGSKRKPDVNDPRSVGNVELHRKLYDKTDRDTQGLGRKDVWGAGSETQFPTSKGKRGLEG